MPLPPTGPAPPPPFRPTIRRLSNDLLEFTGTHGAFGKRGKRSKLTGTNFLHDMLLQDYGVTPQSVQADEAGNFRVVSSQNDIDAISAALAQVASDPVLAEDIQPGLGVINFPPLRPDVSPGPGGGPPSVGPGREPPLGEWPGNTPAEDFWSPGGPPIIAPGYLERSNKLGGGVNPKVADYLGYFKFNRGTSGGVPEAYGRLRANSLRQFLRHLRNYYGGDYGNLDLFQHTYRG